VDLRDQYGVTQIVFNPEQRKNIYEQAMALRAEFVISIEGKVSPRPEGMLNKEMKTGAIEVIAENVTILNTAKTPPFEIIDEIDVHEELKLQYRYLDLRRTTNKKNILLRSRLYKVVRDFLVENRFTEIETPFLMKSTPEGARDFLVPSRNYNGRFYALPQSPQTYKQILMIAGFDRYFQIVKCFRDEDLRKDRQPEFTQIDIEMSFVNESDVITISESLVKRIYKEIKDQHLEYDFPRMTYDQAMSEYGSDKPDLRFDLKIKDLGKVFSQTEFNTFSAILSSGGHIAGLCVDGTDKFSRKQIDKLTEFVKNLGAKGLVWLKNQNAQFDGPTAKYLSEQERKSLLNIFGTTDNSIIFIIAGEKEKTLSVLGDLRLHLAQFLNLIDETRDSFLWITDFPMLEFNTEENRYIAYIDANQNNDLSDDEPLGAESGYRPVEGVRLTLSYPEGERSYSITIYHYCETDRLYYVSCCGIGVEANSISECGDRVRPQDLPVE